MYNHMYDLAFTVLSETEDGSSVTAAMLKKALIKRIEELDRGNGEWHEATSLCDTYYIEKEYI